MQLHHPPARDKVQFYLLITLIIGWMAEKNLKEAKSHLNPTSPIPHPHNSWGPWGKLPAMLFKKVENNLQNNTFLRLNKM